MRVANVNVRSGKLRGRIAFVRFFSAALVAGGVTTSALAQPIAAEPVLIVPPAVQAVAVQPVAPVRLGTVAVTSSVPGTTPSQAEKLRRLDIMLMVTALRCRKTSDDFQADYDRFEVRHLAEMNGAAAELRKQFVREHGVLGALRALDEVSTSIANSYGEGHPWLGCHDLKTVTQLLVDVETTDTLVEAASQLLDRRQAPQFALAAR